MKVTSPTKLFPPTELSFPEPFFVRDAVPLKVELEINILGASKTISPPQLELSSLNLAVPESVKFCAVAPNCVKSKNLRSPTVNPPLSN
jgi:hypothetical protein